MTSEEISKLISDKQKIIEKAQDDIDDAKDRYIEEHAKFCIGDKVRLIRNGGVFFISSIFFGNSRGENQITFISYRDIPGILYKGCKVKKDGTASSQRAFHGQYITQDAIEKI